MKSSECGALARMDNIAEEEKQADRLCIHPSIHCEAC